MLLQYFLKLGSVILRITCIVIIYIIHPEFPLNDFIMHYSNPMYTCSKVPNELEIRKKKNMAMVVHNKIGALLNSNCFFFLSFSPHKVFQNSVLVYV